MTTRYYLDTEFHEGHGELELISIALVCDDGREFYATSSTFETRRLDPWVVEHVLPHLPPKHHRKTPEQIAIELRAFVTGTPEIWAWFASHDWVLFCWALGGRMIDTPKGWPQAPMDLRQAIIERGIRRDSLPPQIGKEHDALEDARWLRDACASALGHKVVMR